MRVVNSWYLLGGGGGGSAAGGGRGAELPTSYRVGTNFVFVVVTKLRLFISDPEKEQSYQPTTGLVPILCLWW